MLAPDAFNEAVLPLQINGLEIPMVGRGLTVTTLVAEAEQPDVVPVAVYVVVLPGVTLMLIVVAALLHRYVVAPLAVRVVEKPAQIVLAPLMLMVGVAFTVTVVMAGEEEQIPVVPVTV